MIRYLRFERIFNNNPVLFTVSEAKKGSLFVGVGQENITHTQSNRSINQLGIRIKEMISKCYCERKQQQQQQKQ